MPSVLDWLKNLLAPLLPALPRPLDVVSQWVDLNVWWPIRRLFDECSSAVQEIVYELSIISGQRNRYVTRIKIKLAEVYGQAVVLAYAAIQNVYRYFENLVGGLLSDLWYLYDYVRLNVEATIVSLRNTLNTFITSIFNAFRRTVESFIDYVESRFEDLAALTYDNVRFYANVYNLYRRALLDFLDDPPKWMVAQFERAWRLHVRTIQRIATDLLEAIW